VGISGAAFAVIGSAGNRVQMQSTNEKRRSIGFLILAFTLFSSKIYAKKKNNHYNDILSSFIISCQ
jgi:hypothetical protein